MSEELEVGAWYEARKCEKHPDNKGNVFKLEAFRVEMFGDAVYKEQLACGCLIKTPMDDINFPQEPE